MHVHSYLDIHCMYVLWARKAWRIQVAGLGSIKSLRIDSDKAEKTREKQNRCMYVCMCIMAVIVT